MADFERNEETGETVISMNHNGVVRKFIVPLGALTSQQGASGADLPPIASPAIRKTAQSEMPVKRSETKVKHKTKRLSLDERDKPLAKQPKKDGRKNSFEDALARVGKIANHLKQLRDAPERTIKEKRPSAELAIAAELKKLSQTPNHYSDTGTITNEQRTHLQINSISGAGKSDKKCSPDVQIIDHVPSTVSKTMSNVQIIGNVRSTVSNPTSDVQIVEAAKPDSVRTVSRPKRKSAHKVRQDHDEIHTQPTVAPLQNKSSSANILSSASLQGSAIVITSGPSPQYQTSAGNQNVIVGTPVGFNGRNWHLPALSDAVNQATNAQNQPLIINQTGVTNIFGQNRNQSLASDLNQSKITATGTQPIILGAIGNQSPLINQTANQGVVIGNSLNIPGLGQTTVLGNVGNQPNLINQSQPIILGQTANQTGSQPIILSAVGEQQPSSVYQTPGQNPIVILGSPGNQSQTTSHVGYVPPNNANTNTFNIQGSSEAAIQIGNANVYSSALPIKQNSSNLLSTVLTPQTPGSQRTIVLPTNHNVTNPIVQNGTILGQPFQSFNGANTLLQGSPSSSNISQPANSLVLPAQQSSMLGNGVIVQLAPPSNSNIQNPQTTSVQNVILPSNIIGHATSPLSVGPSFQITGKSLSTNASTLQQADSISSNSANSNKYQSLNNAVNNPTLESMQTQPKVVSSAPVLISSSSPLQGSSSVSVVSSLCKKLTSILNDNMEQKSVDISKPKILPKPVTQTSCNTGMTMAVPLYATATTQVQTVSSTALSGIVSARNTLQVASQNPQSLELALTNVLQTPTKIGDSAAVPVKCEDNDDDVIMLSPNTTTVSPTTSQTPQPSLPSSSANSVTNLLNSSENVQGPLFMKDLKGKMKRIFGFTYLNNVRHAVVQGDSGFVALPLPEVPDVNQADTTPDLVSSSDSKPAVINTVLSTKHSDLLSTTNPKNITARVMQCKKSKPTIKIALWSKRQMRNHGLPVVVLHNLNISNQEAPFKSHTLRAKFRHIVNCKSRRGLFEKFLLAKDGRALIKSRDLYKGKVESHFGEGTYMRVLELEGCSMYDADTDIEESTDDKEEVNEKGKLKNNYDFHTCEINEKARNHSRNIGFVNLMDVCSDKNDQLVDSDDEQLVICEDISAEKPPVLQKCSAFSNSDCESKQGPPTLHLYCDGKNCARCHVKNTTAKNICQNYKFQNEVSEQKPGNTKEIAEENISSPNVKNNNDTNAETGLDQSSKVSKDLVGESSLPTNGTDFATQRTNQILSNTMAAFLHTPASDRLNSFEYFQGILSSFAKRPAILPKPE